MRDNITVKINWIQPTISWGNHRKYNFNRTKIKIICKLKLKHKDLRDMFRRNLLNSFKIRSSWRSKPKRLNVNLHVTPTSTYTKHSKCSIVKKMALSTWTNLLWHIHILPINNSIVYLRNKQEWSLEDMISTGMPNWTTLNSVSCSCQRLICSSKICWFQGDQKMD